MCHNSSRNLYAFTFPDFGWVLMFTENSKTKVREYWLGGPIIKLRFLNSFCCVITFKYSTGQHLLKTKTKTFSVVTICRAITHVILNNKRNQLKLIASKYFNCLTGITISMNATNTRWHRFDIGSLNRETAGGSHLWKVWESSNQKRLEIHGETK